MLHTSRFGAAITTAPILPLPRGNPWDQPDAGVEYHSLKSFIPYSPVCMIVSTIPVRSFSNLHPKSAIYYKSTIKRFLCNDLPIHPLI
ncbi:hypothetical protein D3C75_890750 [compost metagenome]